MKIKTKIFHGTTYLAPEKFKFLDKSIAEYPSFCGAGKGIGDKIVPEFIGGMRCSHICHIHDDSFEEAEFSFKDFVLSNAMFLFNLFNYLMSGTGGVLKRVWRSVKGSLYVVAVSTIGWKVFKKLKING